MRRFRFAPLIAFVLATSLNTSSAPAGPHRYAVAASESKQATSSSYWAVIVGISDYAGSTRDLTGPARDAYALRDHLLSLGWRSDHIYVVTDSAATRDGILRGIRWLAANTDDRSVAAFHYSGHEAVTRTRADGDDEQRDVALRTHENALLLDGDLARELAKVRAARFWIDLSLCRAGGFSDPGMAGPGRVITYSSPESELSYDDSGVRHTVFSYFSIVDGMRSKRADRNRDGRVSVEEAFVYARPWVIERTGDRQHPVMDDRLSGDFDLTPSKPQTPPPPPCRFPVRLPGLPPYCL